MTRLYLKKGILVVMLCLMVSGLVVAVSVSVPENVGTVSLVQGDTKLFKFMVNGDAAAQQVGIFMSVPRGLLTFDGKTEYVENVNLGVYESHSVEVLLKAMKSGSAQVTYGVKYGSASGGSIGFEQVSKGIFSVYVSSVQENVTPQTPPKKTSGGGGGGGGGIVGATVKNSSSSVIIPTVDVPSSPSSQDVTGEGAGVDVGVVPVNVDANKVVASVDQQENIPVESKVVEGKSIALLVVILAVVTMVLAGVALKIGKGAYS